ncbi:MAG: FG-GAP-like repeat-containing protein, partial [Proteobacteria bacterium]|nr:FG-GAP-like repeat-containing protein [Pseudomonadota bacterium]
IHHPAGVEKKVSLGPVRPSDDSDILRYEADVWHGTSGAPVLDADGHVVGVVATGLCLPAADLYSAGPSMTAVFGVSPHLRHFDTFDEREAGVPQAGDAYGAALAAGDFNGDGHDDLAVGVPNETPLDMPPRTGMVNVRYGSEHGLTPTGTHNFWQSAGSSPEEDDHFGDVLAAGDFDGDGYDDLAVGTPREDWGSIANAGVVQIYRGGPDGLQTPGAGYFVAALLGGTIESAGRFGHALASGDFDADGYADLAIGSPYENGQTGAVYALRGGPSGLGPATPSRFTQTDTLGGNASFFGGSEEIEAFGWSLAAGDFDGDGDDDLAVGVPFESCEFCFPAVNYVGVVDIVRGGPGGLAPGVDSLVLYQSTGELLETGDYFGLAVAAGDFDGDGFADLAAAAPGDSEGSLSQVGVVSVRRGGSGGLSGAWSHYRPSSLGWPASEHARFGSALAAGRFDGDPEADLAVSASKAPAGGVVQAGRVGVLWGGATGLATASEVSLTEVSPRNHHDRFGRALAAGDYDGDGDADLAAAFSQDSEGVSGHGAVMVSDVDTLLIAWPWPGLPAEALGQKAQ